MDRDDERVDERVDDRELVKGKTVRKVEKSKKIELTEVAKRSFGARVDMTQTFNTAGVFSEYLRKVSKQTSKPKYRLMSKIVLKTADVTFSRKRDIPVNVWRTLYENDYDVKVWTEVRSSSIWSLLFADRTVKKKLAYDLLGDLKAFLTCLFPVIGHPYDVSSFHLWLAEGIMCFLYTFDTEMSHKDFVSFWGLNYQQGPNLGKLCRVIATPTSGMSNVYFGTQLHQIAVASILYLHGMSFIDNMDGRRDNTFVEFSTTLFTLEETKFFARKFSEVANYIEDLGYQLQGGKYSFLSLFLAKEVKHTYVVNTVTKSVDQIRTGDVMVDTISVKDHTFMFWLGWFMGVEFNENFDFRVLGHLARCVSLGRFKLEIDTGISLNGVAFGLWKDLIGYYKPSIPVMDSFLTLVQFPSLMTPIMPSWRSFHFASDTVERTNYDSSSVELQYDRYLEYNGYYYYDVLDAFVLDPAVVDAVDKGHNLGVLDPWGWGTWIPFNIMYGTGVTKMITMPQIWNYRIFCSGLALFDAAYSSGNEDGYIWIPVSPPGCNWYKTGYKDNVPVRLGRLTINMFWGSYGVIKSTSAGDVPLFFTHICTRFYQLIEQMCTPRAKLVYLEDSNSKYTYDGVNDFYRDCIKYAHENFPSYEVFNKQWKSLVSPAGWFYYQPAFFEILGLRLLFYWIHVVVAFSDHDRWKRLDLSVYDMFKLKSVFDLSEISIWGPVMYIADVKRVLDLQAVYCPLNFLIFKSPVSWPNNAIYKFEGNEWVVLNSEYYPNEIRSVSWLTVFDLALQKPPKLPWKDWFIKMIQYSFSKLVEKGGILKSRDTSFTLTTELINFRIKWMEVELYMGKALNVDTTSLIVDTQIRPVPAVSKPVIQEEMTEKVPEDDELNKSHWNDINLETLNDEEIAREEQAKEDLLHAQKLSEEEDFRRMQEEEIVKQQQELDKKKREEEEKLKIQKQQEAERKKREDDEEAERERERIIDQRKKEEEIKRNFEQIERQREIAAAEKKKAEEKKAAEEFAARQRRIAQLRTEADKKREMDRLKLAALTRLAGENNIISDKPAMQRLNVSTYGRSGAIQFEDQRYDLSPDHFSDTTRKNFWIAGYYGSKFADPEFGLQYDPTILTNTKVTDRVRPTSHIYVLTRDALVLLKKYRDKAIPRPGNVKGSVVLASGVKNGADDQEVSFNQWLTFLDEKCLAPYNEAIRAYNENFWRVDENQRREELADLTEILNAGDIRQAFNSMLGTYDQAKICRILLTYLPSVLASISSRDLDSLTLGGMPSLLWDRGVSKAEVQKAIQDFIKDVDNRRYDIVYTSLGRNRVQVDGMPMTFEGSNLAGGYHRLGVPGLGEMPINTEVPLSFGVEEARRQQSGIHPNLPLIKPAQQFQSLVEQASTLIDNKIYKNREQMLNHKADIMQDCLNELKRTFKDQFWGRVPQSRGHLMFTQDMLGTFVPLSILWGTDFIPTSCRVTFSRNWKGGERFGIYYGIPSTDSEDLKVTTDIVTKRLIYQIPIMQYGKATKKSYNFQAAPYFGYADSIFQLMKHPSLAGGVYAGANFLTSVAWDQEWSTKYGLRIKELQTSSASESKIRELKSELAETSVCKIVRCVGDVAKKAKLNSSLMGSREFSDLVLAYHTVQGPIASVDRIVANLKKILASRVPVTFHPTKSTLLTDYYTYAKGENDTMDTINPNFMSIYDLVKSYASSPNTSRLFAVMGRGTAETFSEATFWTNNGQKGRYLGLNVDGDWELGLEYKPAELRSETAFLADLETRVRSLFIHRYTTMFSVIRTDISRLVNLFDLVLSEMVDDAKRTRITKVRAALSNSLVFGNDLQGIINWFGSIMDLAAMLVVGPTENIPAIATIPTLNEFSNKFLTTEFARDIGLAGFLDRFVAAMTRPVKLLVGDTSIVVTDSKQAKVSLIHALNGISEEISNSGSLFADGKLRGEFYMYIPKDAYSIGVGDHVTGNFTFDGYANNVNGALSYLQTLVWIRNFNYGTKLERQKISKNRVTNFVNQDSKQLKKLIYTFGGEPLRFLEKGKN